MADTMEIMKTLPIIGVMGVPSRNTHNDYKLVRNKILSLYKPGTIICTRGAFVGGDNFARIVASNHGFPLLEIFPDKSKFGKVKINTNIHELFSEGFILCLSTDVKETKVLTDIAKKYETIFGNKKLVIV